MSISGINHHQQNITNANSLSIKNEDEITNLFHQNVKGREEIPVIPNEMKIQIVNQKQKKNRAVGRFITQLQEIFGSLKKEYPEIQKIFPTLIKEYPTFPSFNQWFKKYLSEDVFNTHAFSKVIIYNALIEINNFKNDEKINLNPKFYKDIKGLELIFLEFRTFFLTDRLEFLDDYSLDWRSLLTKANFLDFKSLNKLIVICLLLEKILNHKNNKELLNSTQEIKILDLMKHQSLNLNVRHTYSNVLEKFNKISKFHHDNFNFYTNIFRILEKNKYKCSCVVNLLDENESFVKNDSVFRPLEALRILNNEIKKIDQILSDPNEDLETHFNLLNPLANAIFNAEQFVWLLEEMDNSSEVLNRIFKIKDCKEYLELAKSLNEEEPKIILRLLNQKILTIKTTIIDSYYYLFSHFLIEKNNKINVESIPEYFFQFNEVLKEVIHYFSETMHYSTTNWLKRKEKLEAIFELNNEFIHKYSDKELIDKISNGNDIFNIFLIVKDVFRNYIKMETTIKDDLLTQIKVKMHKLKNEKNILLKEKIKEELNQASKCYDNYLKLLNFRHKIFSLYSQEEFLITDTNDERKNELSETEIESYSQDHNSTELEDATQTESDKIIKDQEDQMSVSLDKSQERKLEKEFEEIKINDKTSEFINKKEEKNLPKKSLNTLPNEKSFLEEYDDYLEDSGWNAHMKRRELLQILKKNGWKINASAGKGSHTKAEGPNGTVITVPYKAILAKGTSRSIEESFILDKKKEKEAKNKNESTPINSQKANKKKKKNTRKKK